MPDADNPESTQPFDNEAPTVAPGTSAEPTSGNFAALPCPGDQIEDYEILGEIARGGMGVVYQARHHQLGRLVALKMVLDTDAHDSTDLRERFANEARAAAAIEHPGIVPVYDVGTWNGHPYFTMAYVDGESLHSMLRDGPLPWKRAAEIARDVAEAISHAHAQKIIHRDLKPANILIDKNDDAHVTDFGVSKFTEGGSDLTSHGELVGTPHFMPPEQAGGQDVAPCPGSDVYSIGAVLYASLTGRPPFQGATPVDVVTQVLMKDAVAPSALAGGLPIELDVITGKCLQKKTRDRYQSAQELADDLDRFLNDEPIQAKPPSLWQRGRLLVRRHVLFASVSGTVALLLLFLSTLVSMLYLSARSEVVELTEELESTKSQMESDRAVTKHFLESIDVKSIGEEAPAAEKPNQYAAFQAARLSGIAAELFQSNPDMALQLAVASVECSLEGGVAPDAELLTFIRDCVKASDSAYTADQEASVNSKIAPLLAAAKTCVKTPLTARHRILFGLDTKSDEQASNDESTKE